MFEVLAKGGFIMIPLGICSVISIAIMLERLVYFWSIRGNSQDLLADVRLMISQGKVLDAISLAKKTRTPMGSLIATGLTAYGRSVDDLRDRVQSAGIVEVSKLERNLSILETMATISPLLGLLGTVIGIIRNFNILAMTQGLASTGALSGGIAEALIATASGLCVAIPSMLAHSYFSSRVDRQLTEMNKNSIELLDLLSARGEAV